MRVLIEKWGSSAAVRIPATALEKLELRIGQVFDLRNEHGVWVLEPAPMKLEELVSRITPQNCHGPAFGVDDAAW